MLQTFPIWSAYKKFSTYMHIVLSSLKRLNVMKKMLKARLSPNNSQISPDLLFLTRKTESAKITLIIHTKKRLQSCLHIFLANLKLPRMRYRKNAWNKIWGHPQFAWKKKLKTSELLFINFCCLQIDNKAKFRRLEASRFAGNQPSF